MEPLADPAAGSRRDFIGAAGHLGRLDLDVAIVCVGKRHGDVGRSYKRLWFGYCHPNYDVIVHRIPRYGSSHLLMQVDVRIADRRDAAAEKEQRQDRPGDAPHGDRIWPGVWTALS